MNKAAAMCAMILAVLSSVAAAQEPPATRTLADVRARLIDLYTGRAAGDLTDRGRAAVADLEKRVGELMKRTPMTPEPDVKDERLGYAVSDMARNILTLAQAYVAPDSKLKGSADLKARIEGELRRLHPWIAPGTPRPGNWYPWRIMTPQDLGPALILLQGQVDGDLLKKCRDGMAGLMEQLSLNGANAVWEARNHMYLALLDQDATHMTDAFDFLLPELTVHEESGLLEDYSFQFHGRLPHTGGYGGGFVRSAAEMIYLADQSPWSVSADQRRLLADHLVEHACRVIVGDRYDLSVVGRGVLNDYRATPHLEAMLLLEAALPKGDDESTSRQNVNFSSAVRGLAEQMKYAVGFEFANLVGTREKDRGSTGAQGFRMFYVSDLAVFRATGFYTSVRMYSNRVIDYEGNWGQNMSGWFLTYGMTYISRTGRELSADPATMREHLDWDRLPGTTTRVGVHPAKAYNTGTSPFAGGAGFVDGGVCGFILQPAAGDFVARKSYHFFDRGFVALGSGITSTAPHPEHVVTTVLQWATPTGQEKLVLSGDRVVAEIQGEASWENVSWAWIDGVGCVFPTPVTLHGHRRGKLVTLWLDHGADPRDASYAYIVLPQVERPALDEFMKNPTVRIRQHDAVAHAVEDTSGAGAAGIVFWQAGTAGAIAASAPAVVRVRQYRSKGNLDVSVANPLHTEAKLDLTFASRPKQLLFSLPREASGRTRGDGVGVSLNTAAGRVYLLAIGESGDMGQVPRRDNLAYERFRVQAETQGNVTYLTMWIPKEAADEEGGYRLVIRGSQGHLRKVLAATDLVDVPADLAAKGERGIMARYKWVREGDKVKSGTFSVVLTTRMHMAAETFTVPEP
jgi:hypothetical protein